MDKKIVTIKIKTNLYFIVSHVGSKYHNDFTNQIIDIYQLFDEIKGYASNGIICLENIVEVKDISNNTIDCSELYELLDSIIIMDKLIDDKIYFIQRSMAY